MYFNQLLTILVIFIHSASSNTVKRSRCERITIPMCRDMPYFTSMPNMMQHHDQSEAAIRIHEFKPLMEKNCSKHFKSYLCSLFAPMCSEQVDLPIPSCQSVCQEVKTRCLSDLQFFNFTLSEAFNCSRLPNPEKNELCMEFSNVIEESKVPSKPEHRPRNFDSVSTNNRRDFTPSSACPNRFVLVDRLHRSTEIACTPRCGADAFFQRSHKQFAAVWMGVWAAACFVSTLFTLLTFTIDKSRFRYPERSIVYLSGCYNAYSTAYFVRLFGGSEAVSCDPKISEVILQSLDNTACTLVFLLLYYFGLASCVWWVILTFTWYLAAGKKWGHEAIDSLSKYFHVAAWTTPAILSVVVLTLRRVDGDELTGLCHVGMQDEVDLVAFFVAPLGVLFALGALFIALGLNALVKIRRVMSVGGRNTDKLKKLMVRIGAFSVLYMVPVGGVLACCVYEYWKRGEWRYVAIATSLECLIKVGRCRLEKSIPNVEVFMLKIFLSLAVGITSGMWVWSSKTWTAWRQFFAKFRGQERRKLSIQTALFDENEILGLQTPLTKTKRFV